MKLISLDSAILQLHKMHMVVTNVPLMHVKANVSITVSKHGVHKEVTTAMH